MAFTSRANRFTKHQNPTTSSKVGPGSYSTNADKAPAQHRPTRSSFDSTTSRGLLYYEIDDYQPEPGQYHREQRVESALSTHCNFKSTSRRFVTNNHDATLNPGPAAYDVKHHSIEDKVRKAKLSKAMHDVIQRPLSASNQRAPMAKNPPSIPYGETAFGYETTIDGKLVPRTPPLTQMSSTLDAALYDNEEAGGWAKSKTKRFGGATQQAQADDATAVQSTFQRWVGRREQDAESSHGEEASSDIIYRRHRQAPQAQMQRKRRRRKARQSRQQSQKTMSLVELQKLQRFYTQKMAHSQQRSELDRTNDVLAERERATAEKESFQFRSSTKRFVSAVAEDETPGVGTYDLEHKASAKAKSRAIRPTAAASRPNAMLKASAHDATPSSRHHEYGHGGAEQVTGGELSKLPGPGAYDIKSGFKSMDDINAENIQLGLPPKAPFLSTVGKFTTNIVETTKTTPGPGYYQNASILTDYINVGKKPRIKFHKAPFGQHGDVERNKLRGAEVHDGLYDVSMSSYLIAPNRLKYGATAVFKSETERIGRNKASSARTPGVGAYNIAIGGAQKHEETPHNIYRFETRTDKPFISASDRFAKSKYAVQTPGVGLYDIAEAGKHSHCNEKPAPFNSSNSRFVKQSKAAAMAPAPNAYHVVKQDSFVKKTYNCTFDG